MRQAQNVPLSVSALSIFVPIYKNYLAIFLKSSRLECIDMESKFNRGIHGRTKRNWNA